MTGSRNNHTGSPPSDSDLFEGHHRGLRGHIRTLTAATSQPPPATPDDRALWAAEITASLRDLRNFAEVHFAEEEKLMEDVEFPSHQEHARQHQDFMLWLDRLDALLAQDAAQLHRDAIGPTLGNWWETHAVQFDAQLSAFLCRGGI